MERKVKKKKANLPGIKPNWKSGRFTPPEKKFGNPVYILGIKPGSKPSPVKGDIS